MDPTSDGLQDFTSTIHFSAQIATLIANSKNEGDTFSVDNMKQRFNEFMEYVPEHWQPFALNAYTMAYVNTIKLRG
jgi:hypothetical protein